MAKLLTRPFSTIQKLQQTLAQMNTKSADLPALFHPPINRAMKTLDRSFFKKTIPISAATIFDPRETSNVRKAVAKSRELLWISGVKPVIDDDRMPGAKRILLVPEVNANDPSTWSASLKSLVEDEVVEVRSYDLSLRYEHWSMGDILEATLPDVPEDQKETPTGFAQAGHIAHLNLRNQHLPWKHLIAQVLLDKNPHIRTVINKTLDVGTESVYRTFPYEVLAGDDDMVVTATEQNCEFRFNFAEVYWNSRLSTEHERIVSKFRAGEAVCDVMAGVGPFAVPAGKKGVWVRANDLNPRSYEGLKWAVEKNKVDGFVTASCTDGRKFIREETSKLAWSARTLTSTPDIKLARHASPETKKQFAKMKAEMTRTVHEPTVFDHYVMNLPASAVEFLDAFTGLFHGQESSFAPNTARKLPMVHVYTFQAKRETARLEAEDVCAKISRYLGSVVKATDEDVEVFDVRLVSPSKRFYCASFRLPAQVAFAAVPEGEYDLEKEDSPLREHGSVEARSPQRRDAPTGRRSPEREYVLK